MTPGAFEKRCTGGCGRMLSLTFFGRGKRPGTYHSWCRDCQAADARRRRAQRPDFQQRQLLRDAIADLAADGLKRCGNRDCLRVLPVEEFYRDKRKADGRYNFCKRCCAKIDAARRPKIPAAEPSQSYRAVHSRMPSASVHDCRRCGKPAQEWGYDHADPDEVFSDEGFPYSLDQAHYMPMCRSCHRRYDSEYRQPERRERLASRPRVPRNTCVICGAEFWAEKKRIQSCSRTCESELRSRRQLERQKKAAA